MTSIKYSFPETFLGAILADKKMMNKAKGMEKEGFYVERKCGDKSESDMITIIANNTN